MPLILLLSRAQIPEFSINEKGVQVQADVAEDTGAAPTAPGGPTIEEELVDQGSEEEEK
jgi:hypothetical protein